MVARENALMVAGKNALMVAGEDALMVARENALMVDGEDTLMAARENSFMVARESGMVVARDGMMVRSKSFMIHPISSSLYLTYSAGKNVNSSHKSIRFKYSHEKRSNFIRRSMSTTSEFKLRYKSINRT